MKLGMSAVWLSILCVAPGFAAERSAAAAPRVMPRVAPMPVPRPVDAEDEEGAPETLASADMAALESLAPPEPAWDTSPSTRAASSSESREADEVRHSGRRARVVSPLLRALVAQHAQANDVPVGLAHAIVLMESGYEPRLSHAGNLGLMQIKTDTARSLGFSGGASALLDPDTNLRFGMRYLASAWRASGGDLCGAVMRYQSGARAVRMTAASRASCARVKELMHGA